MGNKDWVAVYFDNGTKWIPAFEDVWKICWLIGLCEDEKYGFPRNNVKGAEMVWESIKDAVLLGADEKTIPLLKRKYRLPEKITEMQLYTDADKY